MKQMIAAMMIFFFVATVAQAQTAATTGKSLQTEKTDVKAAKTTCCGHDLVDANGDGFCDKCGMKSSVKQTTSTKSGCSGTTNKSAGCSKSCSKSCAKTCGGMNNSAGTKPKE